MINKTITSPKGFLAAGVKCGIKASGKHDLGLIVCPLGAVGAAVFTTNKITAAPVQISKKHIKGSKIDAIVINSGNANCCTGKTGLNDAIKMCQMVADDIQTKPENILVASTGVIGRMLPMAKVSKGIKQALKELKSDKTAGENFQLAILTTDTKPKSSFAEISIGKTKVKIAGTVKGAGMIGPNMATTLCFLTTDANISKALLQKALAEAIGNSLNKLTVDGHQSTNDTAIILTSGLAGNKKLTKADSQYSKFAAALDALCNDLAKQMAMDAEGATRIFKVIVSGAKTKAQAAKAARAVADYDLVKCAIHGGDPNWGRIICAVGSCGVDLNPSKLSCKIGKHQVFKNGSPVKFDPAKVSKTICQKEHSIQIELGVGKHQDFCYGCDLSKDYVSINADYTT